MKLLTAFGRALKGWRTVNGSLDLSQGAGGELKFKLTGEGEPVEVHGKEQMEVHSTIEELMVLANCTVARIIARNNPAEPLLRIHPPPTIAKLKNIKELAAQLGLTSIFNSNAPEELRQQVRSFREKILHPKSLSSQPSTKSQSSQLQLSQSQSTQSQLQSISSSNQGSQHTADFVTSAVIKSMNEAKCVYYTLSIHNQRTLYLRYRKLLTCLTATTSNLPFIFVFMLVVPDMCVRVH